MARRPQTGLDRGRIVDAAIEVADRIGTGPMTLRRIATELGVSPMAIYHYVADKEEILDAMVDRVFAEIGLPVIGAPWRTEMERRAHSARRALNRHPWAITLLDSRTTPGIETIRHHDAVSGCLRTAGMSIRLTAHVAAALDTVIFGFAVQEAALPFGADDVSDVAGGILEQVPFDQFPHVAEMAANHVLVPGYDFGDEFHYILEMVLDSLEQRFLAEHNPAG
ncbi:MAG: TetR/AcrR family transcriptional regulator [Acidimicrobiia bacterium]